MNRLFASLVTVLLSLSGFSQELTEIQTLRGSDTPNGSGNSDRFGREIKISGSTAIISAPGHNINSGAVYVFENNSNNEWIQVAKLTASDQASGHEFGSSIAIKDDVIVVGKFGSDYSRQGAYVFEKPTNGWTDMTETIKISTPTPPNGLNISAFGSSVDINGAEILVGAPYEDVGATGSAGRMYVYEKSGASWTTAFLRAELTTTNVGSGDNLGTSANFGDNIIVSGALTGTNAGTLHIYERPVGGTWVNATTEDIIVYGSDRSSNDGFGGIVFSSGDNIYTIGGADVSSQSKVNLYAFEKEGAFWSDQSTQNENYMIPLPDHIPFPGFANAHANIDIVVQSNLIFVGSGASTGPTSNSSPVGSVVVYDTSGNIILEIDGLSYASNSYLGTALAIEGSRLLVGSPLETVGGVVRYFDLSYNEQFSENICGGGSIAFGSQTITEPGIYTEMFAASNGLDSLVQLTVNGPSEPMVTTSTTTYGSTTSTGLEITPDTDDNASTHFKISSIMGGNLFLSDGSTEIFDNDFITISQGASGLIFDPAEAANGSFEITTSIGTDGSCVSSSSAVAGITVSKAQLTVSTEDVTITKFDPLPNLFFTYSGFVNGEDASALDTEPTISTTAIAGVSGSYPITISGGVDANYDFIYVNGTLTIEQVLGLHDSQISIYPNPADDSLTIEGIDVFTIKILDLEGRVVENMNGSQELGIRQLKSGVYFLLIKTRSGETVTHSFVKKD